ncbi:hypothetical protein EYF80_032532 [Liparis tanakae]|uniref:Uncharacterized protein n=1 Tax=Liparis tanakae TaxID=230148 RepID=A0A4Z2GWY0_9TELE|nr:hypothetical protein EYF80_032532 [Liparis tanakae]
MGRKREARCWLCMRNDRPSARRSLFDPDTCWPRGCTAGTKGARRSERHVKCHLSEYELDAARLPHQQLPHKTLPQVFQIAVVVFSFLLLSKKHRLSILRLHLRFHRPVLLSRRLSGQRVGHLHEEHFLAFTQTPSMQQLRKNFRLRERRGPESSFRLLDFSFLLLLFY